MIDISLLALYGVLTGFSDFANMSYYLKERESELSEEFGLSEGIPSYDVFSDVFRALDIEKFMALFVEWTKSLIKGHFCLLLAKNQCAAFEDVDLFF